MTARHPGPLVSVVMPFFNAELFFDEAITSVLDQSYPHVELLLCDDGSTDSSARIAKEWAARETSRVVVLEHPMHEHRGTAETRNLGVAAARGELLAFLDADDVWAPDHLAHEVQLLLDHPEAGLVCGHALEWHSWRDPAEPDVWRPPPWPPGSVVPAPMMLTAILHRGAYCTPTCNLLVRRSLLPEVLGEHEPLTTIFEDQALLARLHTVAASVISGSRTAFYRQHDNSTSARAIRDGTYHPGALNRSMQQFLQWLAEFLPTTPAGSDPELQAALSAASAPYGRRAGRFRAAARSRVKGVLPPGTSRLARRAMRRARRLEPVRMGSLRRLTPISRQFGYDRGLPVDRHYIEGFLAQNAHVVAGRVLEVGDAEYTRRFGKDRVRTSDVLNIEAGHPETTFVADLAVGDGLPPDAFDCIVLTQTLHLIYDLRGAVRTLHRILRPGGTVLATFPGISPISTDRWAATWHWALTPLSATRLFGEVFGPENVEVTAYGNVLTSLAFLEGMAAHELRPR
jgi:glycosyltransferase involved in cell wall biosynthesis/SAM-dependent methyltransferase